MIATRRQLIRKLAGKRPTTSYIAFHNNTRWLSISVVDFKNVAVKEQDRTTRSIVTITTNERNNASMENISDIASKIESLHHGKLEDLEVREIARTLNTLAHSIHKDDLGKINLLKRGELSWKLVNKVLAEDGAFDTNGDELSAIPIEKDSLQINYSICHDAIKCLAQSQNKQLYDRADHLVGIIEEYFLQTKSNNLYPIGRSYALLLDYLRNFRLSDDEIIEKVQELLERASRQEDAGNKSVEVNHHIYNAALNTLASRADSSPSAVLLIQEMIEKEGAPLDHISFSLAIKSILSSKSWAEMGSIDGTTGSTTSIVERLLLAMDQLKLKPSQKTMTPILDALSKRGKVDQILLLIDWMEDMYQSHGWSDIRPNKIHFNTFISALAKTNAVDSGIQAMKILEKMKHLHRSGNNEEVQPDLVTCNAVLNAISKEGNPNDSKKSKSARDMCERAESLLQKMEEGGEGSHIVPDLVSYNSVLSAYMNDTSPDVATKVEELLHRMTQRDVAPDLLSYTICINTFARSKTSGSAQKAEDLLRVLEKSYAEGNEDLKPDMRCYNSVIHAWARSSEDGALSQANKILKEMKLLRESGERPDLILDAISYTSIISALTRVSNKKDPESVRLLDDMMSMVRNEVHESNVDSGVYNALIHAQVHSGDIGAAEKAERLLLSMLTSNDSLAVRPNTITFNTVIDAWSKSNEPKGAARAEKLLKTMQKLHEEGYPDVRPDTYSFASVLNAYANSNNPKSARKAEDILKHMQTLYEEGNDNVKPNTICFSTVIKAYSRHQTKDAGERGEDILKLMFEVYSKGNSDAKPNTIAFTSVCNAWSKSGERQAIKKIEDLMKWMTQLSEDGLIDVYPNEFTYNSLLTAVSRNKDPNKATKALDTLRFMQSDRRVKINSFTYTNVLNACAYTHGTPNVVNTALRIAIIVLEEAIENTEPDDRLNILFGAFFQACSNLMPLEKDKAKIEKVVEAVFYKCCDRGQVDAKLLSQVRKACSTQLFLRMFGDSKSFPNLKINDIPDSWKKNVKAARRKM